MKISRMFQPRLALKLLSVALLSVLVQCRPSAEQYQAQLSDPQYLHRSMKRLTDVIVHDIFSPPVASRIYTYPSVAAYEILAQTDPAYRPLAGQLNELTPIPQPEAGKEIAHPVAAIAAFLRCGQQLVFSEEKIEAFREEIFAEMRQSGVPDEVFDRSVAYGESVAQHILAWAEKDRYKQTRSAEKYVVTETEGKWIPTPPLYMEGIEPHWREIRPFVLDSANQFAPELPTAYSLDPNSQFYKEMMEVYETGKNLTDEQREIASFWDCNPYVAHQTGHAMFATKKITPGGHWIGITKIACEQANASLLATSEAYARVAFSLADAFISCWDEKYRSNLIRPETVINQHIDEKWTPLLQTPPFPEYTSGHSVISAAAATTLTQLLGDNFAFTDSTEVEYGLSVRSYPSFFAASEEAAISRLYGGIHYRPAIDNGVKQGRALGAYLNEKVKTSENSQIGVNKLGEAVDPK